MQARYYDAAQKTGVDIRIVQHISSEIKNETRNKNVSNSSTRVRGSVPRTGTRLR